MINLKKEKIIIKDFVNAYCQWIFSHNKCINQKKLDKDWEKLHDKDTKNANILIKKTKYLLILLLSQYHLGEELFKDFEININAKYKDSHLKKIN